MVADEFPGPGQATITAEVEDKAMVKAEDEAEALAKDAEGGVAKEVEVEEEPPWQQTASTFPMTPSHATPLFWSSIKHQLKDGRMSSCVT